MRGRTTIQCTGRRPPYWSMAEDIGAVGEGGPAHPDNTCGGTLQPTWRTGSSWLLDCCDEEAGREEQTSPTFDLQCHVSSVVHGFKIAMFVHTSFTFALMTTGAFSGNICKLFSELKLVTDNLSLYVYSKLCIQ